MKEKVSIMIEGVSVINFPCEIDEHWGKSYPLGSGVVAEKIAQQIPQEIRQAVLIDYERIPEEFFEKEGIFRGREQTPEQKRAEEKLIKAIFGE